MTGSYTAIAAQKREEYGTKVGNYGKIIAEQLYGEKSHFIYELLQNAEDAGASEIEFRLFGTRLEVVHNGRLFDDDDVNAICSIGEGTKTEDLTKIGKFGIGFKSVFALTTAPQIYSGEHHFEIRDYVIPSEVPPLKYTSSDTTFVIPFDKLDADPSELHRLIASRLADLGMRTLLFLRHIQEVKWTVEDGRSGHYLRSVHSIDKHIRRVQMIGQRSEDEEAWLVFDHETEFEGASLKVELAFHLIPDNAGTERIERARDPRLIVFFPTALETHFGFLIQGPFRTTPARDNIQRDHPLNQHLANAAGHLIEEVLQSLKNHGWLTVSALNTLWTERENTVDDPYWFLRPLLNSVVSTLRTRSLLPTYDDRWASATTARFARPIELASLLTPEQLRIVFGELHENHWMTNEITENRMGRLYRFLVGSRVGMGVVTPEGMAERLSDGFFKSVTDEWLIRFYIFLRKQQALWRLGGALRNKSFIRLEDGTHSTAFKPNSTEPKAYLPGKIETSFFPLVRRTLLEDPEAAGFLKDLGLKEPDGYDLILNSVLPKYQRTRPLESDEELAEYARDIESVLTVHSSLNSWRKSDFETKIKAHALVLAKSISDDQYRFMPLGAAFRDLAPEWMSFFAGNPDIWLAVEPCFEGNDSVETLSRWRGLPLFFRSADNLEMGIYRKLDGWYKREVRGHNRRAKFDFEREIYGLQHALQRPTTEKSTFIWNVLLIERGNHAHIRGELQFSTQQAFTNPQLRQETSPMGNLLLERAWLPNKDGDFFQPNQLSMDDLPEQFDRNEQVAKSLGMRISPSQKALDQVAESYGIDESKFKRLLALASSLSDAELEHLERNVVKSPQIIEATPSLDGAFNRAGYDTLNDAEEAYNSVPNPQRRQERVQAEIALKRASGSSAPEPKRRIGVTVQRASKDPQTRQFLKEEYSGRCQICGDTFPRASDGEAYFEAVYLSEKSAGEWLDNPANALCLCASHAAKFLYGAMSIPGIEDVNQHIRSLNNSKGTSISLDLAGERVNVRITQRHLISIQALLAEVQGT